MMQEVPLQVMSERTAEAQATGQHGAARGYVAVSVSANVEQVYDTIKVGT